MIKMALPLYFCRRFAPGRSLLRPAAGHTCSFFASIIPHFFPPRKNFQERFSTKLGVDFRRGGVGADAHIGPCRTCRFHENPRRIRNCLMGRCGHRPLQCNAQVHTNLPKICRRFAEDFCRTVLFCRAEQSSAPTNSIQFSFFFGERGGGLPRGGGEARICLRERGLKRFQCHRAKQVRAGFPFWHIRQ